MKKILLSLLVILLVIPPLHSQIDRVEPLHWWTGMKDPNLQLMIHGDNIAGSKVTVHKDGVSLLSVSSLESPNYLFINLQLDPSITPCTFPVQLHTGNGEVLEFEYELKERDTQSYDRKGFNSSDVIYLVMPDRFANGDPANDIDRDMLEKKLNRKDPYARHGGDLQGIIDHLDYIADMGFTALWLNPVLENNQERQSYHGYAITDFYKVDSRFGSNELYRELAEKAAEKGIKLIMDQVFNHCGSNHWWMKDLPSADWINFSDQYKITNHRRTVNQDPYAAESDRELMRDGWFVPSMPDLNQRNPFMATYLIQNSIWWIEYLGLSGIRMDTYPYPDKYMMADWCKRVLKEYPEFNIVGEEWTTNPLIVSYWQKDQNNRDGYEPHLPSLMDFPLQDAVSSGLRENEGWNTGLIRIYEALANDFAYPDPFNLVVFPDNHDMSRFFMQLDMNPDLYKLGIVFFLTTRGIPQIYYGSEILMTHTEGNDHGNIRKDFPGGWIGDDKNAFTGEHMSESALEMQHFFKILLNWRKTKNVIHNGQLIHYAPENGVYVYGRYNEKESVMVILNKNTDPVELDMNRFKELTNSFKAGIDVVTHEDFSLKGKVKVPPLTPLILELK